MRRAVVLSVVVAVAACTDATAPRTSAVARAPARAALAAMRNDYIVSFANDEPDPDARARGLIAAHGGRLKYVYRAALKGFAVTGLPDAAVEALERNPNVARVEPDGEVSIDGTQTPTPSWGIDRIDAAAGLNNVYAYPNEGTGVTAYIIDTGINTSSNDFSGRVTLGPNFDDATTSEDCHGHGSHVAGILGGTVYGVAKKVSLVGLRVVDCFGNGRYSAVIAGVDWVTQNHAPLSVANLSISGPLSATLNEAVAAAVASGVTVVVAAGNARGDACAYSPAGEPTAITVGATDVFDAWATSYSNFGPCIDIGAPGTGITSDWKGAADATNTLNGTSMASPHVAGAAALYRSVNPSATPSQVASALIGGATAGALSSLPAGTPNRLLYVGFIASGVTPPDASFPAPACGGGFSCSFTATKAGLTSYSWSFSDGGSGNTRTVVHDYPKKGGSYLVTLTVSNGTNSASSTRTVACQPKKGCK